MSEEDEINKLAEKTGLEIAEIRKFGEFIEKISGNIFSNVLGLVSDKFAYYRLERAIMLNEKVTQNLKEKGIDRTKYVPATFSVPIIEKATIEEDDDLHSLWANLLTNALDPNYEGLLHRNFSSILSELEPVDAKTLNKVMIDYNEVLRDPLFTGEPLFAREKLAQFLNISVNDCDISLRNLIRLGIFKPGVIIGNISMSGHRVASYKDTEQFSLTSLGISFHSAINK